MIKKWIQTLLPFDFLAQRLQMTLCDCPKLPVNEKRKKKKIFRETDQILCPVLDFHYVTPLSGKT